MHSDDSMPTVSVFVLNCNDKEYLSPCFASLQELDYPADRHEIVLVDNHSTDGSIEHVRERYPGVRIIAHAQNYGFAGGNNRAAQQSDAQYVAFLNSDTRVDSGWLTGLVEAVSTGEKTVSAASKILSADGKRVDFVGSRLNFYGHGLGVHFGAPYEPGSYDQVKPLPFACGGSMLVDREVFLSVGGFDEDYFIFFEDVDLGWRLWLMGYETMFAPRAVTYHHHHGHWRKRPDIHRMTLLERNALYTIIKNYEDEHVDRVVSLALMLAIERAVVDSELNPEEFGYSFRGVAARRARASVPKAAFCPLVAVDQLIDNLPHLLEKRRQIQAMRQRSDGEFWARFAEGMLLPNRTEPGFVAAQSKLLRDWPLPSFFASRGCSNLLILCHDTVGEKMAGPAIRYWELARVLSEHFHVTLAAPGTPTRLSDAFSVRGYKRMDEASIAPLVQEADVILAFAYMLVELPILESAGKPLILDLYDPYVLENLETYGTMPLQAQQEKHRAFLDALNHQLLAGDFFVCASERQRHFWLGMLAANGRINPSTYDQDKALSKLIDIVPFGLPSRGPVHRKQVLKGVWPGIEKTDKVVLWGGGIWEWMDPLTLIRAMGEIAAQHPEVKLFFMGKGHHDPTVAPETGIVGQATQLAQELGVLGKSVFFGNWVPYDERENYLLEADLGVNMHHDHVETRYSFRTRLLDYIWTGLPSLVTEGDSLGDLMAREGLARSVPAADVDAVARGLVEMLAAPDLKQELAVGFARVAERFQWENVAEPIVAFCRQPWTAPDRAWVDVDVTQPALKPPPWWTLPGKAWHYVRRGGPAALWRAAGQYLRWLRIIRRRQSGKGL